MSPTNQNELLLSGATDLDNLETVLSLLSAPNLKKLCKEFNLKPGGSGQKSDCVAELLAHSKKKTFSFNTKGDTSGPSILHQKIMQKARPLLGDCYKLAENPR